ncbi:phosphotransferase [Paenibacillus hexagrammi]|uniref:Phosphotransferase n=1 Tax=Paenibacillus hexagrammi TaxID=2908839 RepID=A0ABY3SNA5_9BACL|nr:phosphotransferase [Paenibacillus sp. YPD9-1]UJF35426.1 phosphotransferase [Paenibacillus sp. YPD9-1]
MNSDVRLEDLPGHWFPHDEWTMVTGTGGMNNTTCFVELDDHKYVLRIYETHRDLAKIEFEHHVLLALARLKLPFRTPVPISLPSGETMIELTDGTRRLAALFSYTVGINPSWRSREQLEQVGLAVGQISAALRDLPSRLQPVYRPYYEIDQIHPRCTPEVIFDFFQNPPSNFQTWRPQLSEIEKRFRAFFDQIPKLQQLPHQLVHGDINASNMLVKDGGAIAAILDFEFVTWDLKVMELAVCVSDLIDPSAAEGEMWGRIEALFKGYRQAADLSEDEVRLLPLLIELRRLDVFVHFLGRYLDGVDQEDVLAGTIMSTVEKTRWLEQYGERVVNIWERIAVQIGQEHG